MHSLLFPICGSTGHWRDSSAPVAVGATRRTARYARLGGLEGHLFRISSLAGQCAHREHWGHWALAGAKTTVPDAAGTTERTGFEDRAIFSARVCPGSGRESSCTSFTVLAGR